MRLKAWVFLNLFSRMMRVFLRACQVIEGFKKAPQKSLLKSKKEQQHSLKIRPKIVVFTYFQVVSYMVQLVHVA